MRRGFTLVEMLVVIGIIAIISAAAVGSYGYATKKAQIARGRELVSNVSTALISIFQERGRWPEVLVNANGADDYRLNARAGAVLARKNAMSLSCREDDSGQYVLTGLDRLGVADPWAQATLRKKKNASLSTRVSTGGTVSDHIIRFAIDVDGIGITTANVCGKTIRVRASAIVWSCGPDGKFGSLDDMGRSDDIFSFREGQIIK